TVEIRSLLFGQLDLFDCLLANDALKDCKKVLGWNNRFVLELSRKILGKWASEGEGPQDLGLRAIGAHVCYGRGSDQDEALAVFVRVGPPVRPGIMTAGAVFGEKGFACLGFVAVDFAEHVLRPAWGRQARQKVFDPLKLEDGAVRVEQPFGGGFGCQVDGQIHALRLSKIAVNWIFLKSGPLCPQTLRRIPEEGGFDRRIAGGPVLGNSWQRRRHAISDPGERVHPARPPG